MTACNEHGNSPRTVNVRYTFNVYFFITVVTVMLSDTADYGLYSE